MLYLSLASPLSIMTEAHGKTKVTRAYKIPDNLSNCLLKLLPIKYENVLDFGFILTALAKILGALINLTQAAKCSAQALKQIIHQSNKVKLSFVLWKRQHSARFYYFYLQTSQSPQQLHASCFHPLDMISERVWFIEAEIKETI